MHSRNLVQDSSPTISNSLFENITPREFQNAPQNRDDRSRKHRVARKLMGDLLTVVEFAETAFAFTDLSQHNADLILQEESCLRILPEAVCS